MGQKEKLIEQLKSRPKTFTFHDAEALLDYLEFTKSNKGKTSGSRVMFTRSMGVYYYISRIRKRN